MSVINSFFDFLEDSYHNYFLYVDRDIPANVKESIFALHLPEYKEKYMLPQFVISNFPNLKEIHIPADVDYVMPNFILNCPNLRDVYIKGKDTAIVNNAFSSIGHTNIINIHASPDSLAKSFCIAYPYTNFISESGVSKLQELLNESAGLVSNTTQKDAEIER